MVKKSLPLSDKDSVVRSSLIQMSEASYVEKRTSQRGLARDTIERLVRESQAHFDRVDLDASDVIISRPYIPGESLEERINTKTLSPMEVMTLLQSLSDYLLPLHEKGIFHQNIKPRNIILTEGSYHGQLVDGGYTVLDFGPSLSETHTVTSLRFLAPELLGNFNRPVTAATDIYGLGLVSYMALTGELPFTEVTMREIIREQMVTSFPDPRLKNSTVPRALAEVVLRMVSKDPELRYQTLSALKHDLTIISEALLAGDNDPDLVIGQTDLRVSLTLPGFTGLKPQLKRIDESLAKLSRSATEVLLIEAESGGGKSRLLEEAQIRARTHGFSTFVGQGLRETAQRPYAFLAGVVQDLISRARAQQSWKERLAQRLQVHRDALLMIFPELEEVLGTRADELLSPSELGSSRGVEILSDLVAALGSKNSPTFLIIDDGQWLDQLSWKVVENIQLNPPAFVSVLFAFRSDEVSAQLRQNLNLGGPQSLRIEPFTLDETVSFVRSMSGRLPARAEENIFSLSKGNPFLIYAEVQGMVENKFLIPSGSGWIFDEELWRIKASSVRSKPLSLRYLESLDGGLRKILEGAAILGKSFRPASLGLILQMSQEKIMESLKVIEKKHLVVPPHDGQEYSFFHDKIREAILSQMDLGERKQLHLRFARTLNPNDESMVFGLSYHLDAAGESLEALPFALRAGKRAKDSYAFELAQEHFTIALKGAELSLDFNPEQVIHEELGEVLLYQGAYEEACSEFEKALALAETPIECARNLAGIAELRMKQSRFEEAYQAAKSALRHLGHEIPDTTFNFIFSLLKGIFIQIAHRLGFKRQIERNEKEILINRLYLRLGYIFYFNDNTKGVWSMVEQLNHAERMGRSPELGQSYSTYGVFFLLFPLLKASEWALNKSLTIRRELKDKWGEGQTLHILVSHRYIAGEYENSIQTAQLSRNLLKTTGDLWAYNDCHYIECLAMYRLGRVNEALKLSKEIYERANRIGDIHSTGFALSLWAHASGGDVPEELIQKEKERSKGDVMTSAVVHEAYALKLMSQDQMLKAIDILEQTLIRIRKARLENEYVGGVLMLLTTCLRQQLEKLSPHAHEERRVLLKRLLKASRQSLSFAKRFKNHMPHALREKALLLSLQGKNKAAATCLDESLKFSNARGAKLESAKTLAEKTFLNPKIVTPTASDETSEYWKLLRHTRVSSQEGSDHQPASWARSYRFNAILERGREIIVSTDEEKLFSNLGNAAQELLQVDIIRILRDPQQIKNFKDKNKTYFLESLQPVKSELLVETARDFGLSRLLSALYLPITSKGEMVALVLLGHSELGQHFNFEKCRLAEFLSALSGAALENLQIVDEIQNTIRMRDEFVEISSHELRTPLTSFMLQIGLMKKIMANPKLDLTMKLPKVDQLLERAGTQVHEFNRLIERLLITTKMGDESLNLTREKFDLAELTRSIADKLNVSMAGLGSRITVVAENPVVGSWDRIKMEEAITNLLSNAMKFGAGQPVKATLRSSGEMLTLSVQDFGMGIASEDLDKIFQRYSRGVSARNYGGFGLGLYVTKKIVEAHQGEISVESQLGRGTTFTVLIPRDAV